jgi:hypothetical protein
LLSTSHLTFRDFKRAHLLAETLGVKVALVKDLEHLKFKSLKCGIYFMDSVTFLNGLESLDNKSLF